MKIARIMFLSLLLMQFLPSIFCFAEEGDILWVRTYDSGNYDFAYGVAVDSNDNIIVAGGSNHWSGLSDACHVVIKYNSDGDRLWERSDVFGDSSIARSVTTDSVDNIIVSGDCIRNSSGQESVDWYIVKYSSDGNMLWSRFYDAGYRDSVGGVTTDSNDNIIVTGTIVPVPELNNGRLDRDYHTIKYDPDGNIVWAKSYGGSDTDCAESVTTDSQDNIIVTGKSEVVSPCGDYYTIKYDLNGNVLWLESYDGGVSDWAYSVAVDSNDNIIVAGYTCIDFDIQNWPIDYGRIVYYTVKYDPEGNMLWSKHYDPGHRSCAYGITVDSNDNIIVTGWGRSSMQESDGDYTIKYDPDGNMLWSRHHDLRDYALCIAVDSNDNIIVAGQSHEDSCVIKYEGSPPVRNVSGTIRYENRIFNETGAGDPDMVEFKPVRFAKIEIISASDETVLAVGQTDRDGAYDLEIRTSLNDKIYLRCYAYQDNEDYSIAVSMEPYSLDNIHYKDSEEIGVSQDNLVIDLDITEESGKGGAFNIFDCLVEGIDTVKELSGIKPSMIPVIWEKDTGDETSYDCIEKIIKLSGSLSDPDEYDDSVILHEYGHFIMDKFSFDKSPGGEHQANDTNQDIRLSWSEGWATYFGGLTRDNSKYVDIKYDEDTKIQRTIWHNIESLDSDIGSLTLYAQGQDTEITVSSILWDIYDSEYDDKDNLYLRAQPVWEAFSRINSSDDCVLEDFYNSLFVNPLNEAYRNGINNIFASRKVFYSDSAFKRGKVFIEPAGRNIPDGEIEGIVSEIEVADDALIKDINVFVDISHSRRSDLGLTLISPDNTEVILEDYALAKPGRTNDIFAWYQKYETPSYQNMDSILKGKNTKGVWKLKVVDRDSQDIWTNGQWIDDVGVFNRWKLEIKERPAKIEINLQQGWNFVSFPLLPEDRSIKNVLSSIEGEYIQVSRYNAQERKFEHYVGDSNYDQFNSFEYARGYQVYINNPNGCTLVIAGQPIAVLQIVQLSKGWNLISPPGLEDMPVEEALKPLQIAYDYSQICRYNPFIEEFEKYSQELQEFDVVKAGESYYLDCTADMQWLVEP